MRRSKLRKIQFAVTKIALYLSMGDVYVINSLKYIDTKEYIWSVEFLNVFGYLLLI